MKKRILFVCLGNICRSVTAEEIMRTRLKEAGLHHDIEVDSAGISSWHAGELADPRMRHHAARRGYELTHRSRPVAYADFFDFDLILGMDDSNMQALRDMAPGAEEEKKLHRMTDYCVRHAGADHVPDPYYGGDQGFERVIDLLEDACSGLLASLQQEQE